jgi:hypothetical protein
VSLGSRERYGPPPGGRPAERRGTIAAIFLAARCDFDNKNGAAPLPAGF